MLVCANRAGKYTQAGLAFLRCGGKTLKQMMKSKTVGIRQWVVRSGFLCVFVMLTGCGNKGPLYIDPDSETLKELEQAEQEINRVTNQIQGTPVDPDDPDGKNKKNSNGQ